MLRRMGAGEPAEPTAAAAGPAATGGGSRRMGAGPRPARGSATAAGPRTAQAPGTAQDPGTGGSPRTARTARAARASSTPPATSSPSRTATSRTSRLRRVVPGSRATAPAPVAAPVPPPKVGGKNHPTPTRSSAQAARRRPLVPTDRKAAARTQRESARAQRAVANAGMLAGDERYLMARDRGPVRRHVRDVVDARRNAGENLIVIALAILLLQFLLAIVLQGDPQAAAAWAVISSLLLPGVFLVIIVDSFLLRRRVRASVAARFGPEAADERGLGFYGITRALQMRRARRPAPAVPRGGAPR